jgi:hypothetical protein
VLHISCICLHLLHTIGCLARVFACLCEQVAFRLNVFLTVLAGPLGYHNYRDFPSLGKMQLSLQTSFEREQHYQEANLNKRAAREPHPAFRFRMLFRHFVQYFRCAAARALSLPETQNK